MMQPREQQLATGDGVSLFVTDWPLASGAPVAGSILLMHGLGEHSGRYTHIVRFLNRCGLVVRSYDQRGHGRSGGPRGDVPDDTALLRDAKIVLDDFAQQQATVYPAMPALAPLLFGHSMGGLFASRFATAGLSPLRGLILSSPALALRLSRFQLLLLKLLTTIAPGYAVPSSLSSRWLSHDQSIGNAYSTDPLVHNKISARLLGSMLRTGDFALQHAPALSIPTLLLVAGDDHLVNPEGSRRFFAALRPEVGKLHDYDGLYHEIFNELGAERVFADLLRWLTAQQMLQALGANPAETAYPPAV